MNRTSSKGTRPRGGAARVPTLEPKVRQAVHRFVRVLAHCGCNPQAIEHEVMKACRRIPRSWLSQADLRDSLDPAHVMTLWFSDPACLDPLGRPQALRLRGSPVSLETLAHRIDPNLDVRFVVRYLEHGGALKRFGNRYLPKDRFLILRGRERMTPFLRGLFGLLKTLEHNSQCRGRTAGWLERFSINPRLPVSAVRSFDKRLRVLINSLLVKVDADMHRHECAARKGEKTVRMGVGVYRFEEEPASRHVRVRRSGRRPGARRGAG
jgi:Family of unknown function (DUF6502)